MEIVERIDPQHVLARINGAYGQPEVVWRAEIMTLNKYRSLHPTFEAEFGDKTVLMEIDRIDAPDRNVAIALPVDRIAPREVALSAVMLGNYRRPRAGLHQWSG